MLIPQDVLEAFARLEAQPDFSRIRDWIEDQQRQAVEALSVANDLLALGRAQGQHQLAEAILQTARKARGVLQSAAGRPSGSNFY